MLQVEVANVLITQCLSTFEVLQNINVKSLLRSFDAFDLPYAVDPKFVKVLGSVCLDLSPTSDVAGAHQRQLKRNVAAFDLEIDEVVGDGDCAFTSIIKQLHKVVPTMTRCSGSCTLLGLLQSETEDTFALRQMFVDQMLEPDGELREFIRKSNPEIFKGILRNLDVWDFSTMNWETS